MQKVWSEQNKFDKWLKVEILACEGLAELGEIPKSSVQNIKKKAKFSIKRIGQIEEKTKHDVIAFLTNVAENVGKDSRYIHLGLTSSDVLDTALAIQLNEASDILLIDLEKLAQALKEKAFQHKNTVMIGRSHGIHAEPITFGLKMALWHDEIKRNIVRMKRAKEVISYGKISGAVGTFANIDPFVEEYVCKKSGLKAAPLSTQIIQRDRHAEFMSTLAITASSLSKFALEIRHLQRTEVMEAEESFSKGQKGSSAMPHKKNPIISERISGLARIIQGNSLAAYENVVLWHERDISHSSVERVILPDSTILLNYMTNCMTILIKNLVVYPENMKKNLQKTQGLIFSQRVLLELAKKGVSREDAYQMVQRNAMSAIKNGKSFKKLLLADKKIRKSLSEKDIKGVFSVKYHLKNIDFIFKRVFD
jgi:adenylosuccinate lyase